ncbi:Hypothetical predicted protein [Mytilus galloprovincialis]|uniref:Uncharacterized protein n=1 Tax=Mytilus galloprovincialis TaxID=29158 RepID=A0A8B6DJ93_MYTGA|nr:Hypothetical predicted protein [Mytilus galloprovincialis]
MSSKLKTVRAAHRRAVIKILKKGDPTEEPQQDVVNLRSMMELIKTKQKTLSDLNDKILESIEEEEELDEKIEEVDRYELEIQIGITKIEKFIKEYEMCHIFAVSITEDEGKCCQKDGNPTTQTIKR